MPISTNDGPYNFWTANWNAVPGVYVITNASRQVIYIGETEDLSRRMAEHRRNTQHAIHRHAPALVWVEVTSGPAASRIARQNALIAEYSPLCNIQGIPSFR